MPEYTSSPPSGILNSDLYFDLIEKRGRKFLTITRSRDFKKLQGLELEINDNHLWGKDDKLHKLSLRYYGSMNFWWVIGLVNRKPTDGHYKIGDIVYIPRSPQVVIGALR